MIHMGTVTSPLGWGAPRRAFCHHLSKVRRYPLCLRAADPTATYCELDLGREDDAKERMIQGMTDVELSEMIGFAKRAQMDLKAWVTKMLSRWRQLYKEPPTIAARRCVFYRHHQ